MITSIKTVKELREYFNTTFGLGEWPKEFIVSSSLYGLVCQEIINHSIKIMDYTPMATYKIIEIKVGHKGGIMFKNVELIIGS